MSSPLHSRRPAAPFEPTPVRPERAATPARPALPKGAQRELPLLWVTSVCPFPKKTLQKIRPHPEVTDATPKCHLGIRWAIARNQQRNADFVVGQGGCTSRAIGPEAIKRKARISRRV